jgi:hypothetical protein
MITTVQIRLIADTRDEALAAIAELRNYVGNARISLASPREGRKGRQWLAYGTFQFESGESPTVVALAPATGPTTRLRRRT